MLAAKTVRRLMAADGYLQLGLPAAALKELDGLPDAGPLASARDYLVGQALMADDRHEDALEPLRRAAEAIPAPWNRAAYESLSECFRATGQQELADVTDFFGEDDGVPAGFDPDAAPADPASLGTVTEYGWSPVHDAAESAAATFEAAAPEPGEAAWVVAEDFGDAAALHDGELDELDELGEEVAPTLWGGDGFGGSSLSDEGQTGDFAADADAMEPGRPREWDAPAFDGGFGTDDDFSGPAFPPRR